MAGTLKIGGNTIATHAGSEGAGTVTLDSSTLTIGSNVSLTSATFPAGHVIHADFVCATGRHSAASSSWDSKWNTSFTFTPKLASSNIYLVATISTYISGSNTAHFDFYKSASDVTATYNLSGVAVGIGVSHNNASWQTLCMTFVDPVAENSITEKTYSISFKNSGSGTVYCGDGANAKSTITAMEVAT